MYSITSRSVLPCTSSSRVCRRRSSASGACESAMVWFWQTRQRSSEVTRTMRASSAGSSASGTASRAATPCAAAASPAATTQPRNARARNERGRDPAAAIEPTGLRIELLEQRLDLVGEDLGRERADVLHADDAVAVDDEGLRHAVHAEIDADPSLVVEERGVVRVAEAGQPAVGVEPRVLVVEAIDRHGALLGELDEHRVLLAAGDAPRGPDVEDEGLAAQVLEAHRLA